MAHSTICRWQAKCDESPPEGPGSSRMRILGDGSHRENKLVSGLQGAFKGKSEGVTVEEESAELWARDTVVSPAKYATV